VDAGALEVQRLGCTRWSIASPLWHSARPMPIQASGGDNRSKVDCHYCSRAHLHCFARRGPSTIGTSQTGRLSFGRGGRISRVLAPRSGFVVPVFMAAHRVAPFLCCRIWP
jgi:hypothetical protein